MPTSWITRLTLPILILHVFASAAIDPNAAFQYRQNSASVVTGVTSGPQSGFPGVRREIRDLRANYPDQWNLYLLALASLQQSDQRDPLSWYGLASIHGRPYQTWGDAPGIPQNIGKVGYCPHQNQLFLGWHRAYLALFEQTLQSHVQRLVEASPSDRFAAAADEFRVPYWDWASYGSSVPDFFLRDTIEVVQLDGSQDVIQNPLFSYSFHQLIPGHFDGRWASLPSTVRWPTSAQSDAQSQPFLFQGSYNARYWELLEGVALSFRNHTFAEFSDALQVPHDYMHFVVGGFGSSVIEGHFSPFEYSAFEPMFMLHHANVDRLFAMWQAVHPGSFMSASNVGSMTNVFLQAGQGIDGNTALLPFRKDSNTFWTTNQFWDHTILGYTYPELQPWGFQSDADYRAMVTATISRLYSGSARGRIEAQGQTTQQVVGGIKQEALVDDLTFTEWTIQTRTREHCIRPPFIIDFLFKGPLGDNDTTTRVGTWMVLMPSDGEFQDIAEMGSDATLNGTLTLTTHLLAQIRVKRLKSLSPVDVVPFLHEKLDWNIYFGDDRSVSRIRRDSIEFEVFSTEARIPQDPNLPISYSKNATIHPELSNLREPGTC